MRTIMIAACTVGAVCSSVAANAMTPAPPAPVQMHGPPAAAQAIYAAELAFEQASVGRGATAAYAEFMDPSESIALTGALPVHGAKAISAAMGGLMGQGVLSWTPEEVFASTGDLGVAEGRWIFRAKDGSKLQAGHYVTVWRKDAAGAWKGLIDVGVPES